MKCALLIAMCAMSMMSMAIIVVDSKVFTRCELAMQLHYRHKVSRHLIPSLLCVAKFASNYNTSADSGLLLDGSRSHGLFQVSGTSTIGHRPSGANCHPFSQINDLKWCDSGDGHDDHQDLNLCKISCDKLHDDRLDDDVRCLNRIVGTSGFHELEAWTRHCKGNYLMHYLQACVL